MGANNSTSQHTPWTPTSESLNQAKAAIVYILENMDLCRRYIRTSYETFDTRSVLSMFRARLDSRILFGAIMFFFTSFLLEEKNNNKAQHR